MPEILVPLLLLLEVLVADAMGQPKPKQELHRVLAVDVAGSFLQSWAQNKACMQKQKIRLPNTTVVVARTEDESLDWFDELVGIPYELETEFSPACKRPYLERHEVKKPRTYTGISTYECGGFLNFIVHEYNELPKVSAFVHGKPRGMGGRMHGDPHIFSVIRHIAADPNKVVGYCSLNRNSTYATDTVSEWKETVRHMDPLRFGHLIAAWMPMLQGEKMLTCFDSGQFAVSRERIHAHPRAFYQELLDWVRDAQTKEEEEDHQCEMLETAWHRIFGEASVCPRNKDRCAIGYGLDHR